MSSERKTAQGWMFAISVMLAFLAMAAGSKLGTLEKELMHEKTDHALTKARLLDERVKNQYPSIITKKEICK